MARHSAVLAQIERRENLEQERRERAKAELAAVRDGVAETLDLEKARGAEFIEPSQKRGEGLKPALRKTQLVKLLGRQEIDARQFLAGCAYADVWNELYASGGLGSCLDDSVRVQRTWGVFKPTAAPEGRVSNLIKLDRMNNAMVRLSTGVPDVRKAALLVEVCGKDRSLADVAKLDSKQRGRLLERLCEALDQVANELHLA